MKYSLQQISDRLEIEDVLVAYSEAIDTQNFEALDDIFTEDAEIDYSAMGGPVGSYPEVKAFLQQSLPAFKNTQHMISNFQISLDKNDADKAVGKIMCFNPMELELGEQQDNPLFFLGLWYIDSYQRVDNAWRISRRREIKSYDFNTPDFIQFD